MLLLCALWQWFILVSQLVGWVDSDGYSHFDSLMWLIPDGSWSQAGCPGWHMLFTALWVGSESLAETMDHIVYIRFLHITWTSPRMTVTLTGVSSQQTEPAGCCQSLQAWLDMASLHLHSITKLPRFMERRHRPPFFQWEECKRNFLVANSGILAFTSYSSYCCAKPSHTGTTWQHLPVSLCLLPWALPALFGEKPMGTHSAEPMSIPNV